MVDAEIKQMKWANALSTRPSLEAALEDVVEQTRMNLSDPADLAIVFISAAFASEYSRLMPLLQERLAVPALIGCGGGGVIGMNRQGVAQEVEDYPALSLSLAYLPGVNITPFRVTENDLPDLDSPPDHWINLMQVSPSDNPSFILLADPFSARVNNLLEGLDYAYPNSIKLGGLASAGTGNSSSLFCNYCHYQEGVVGVALSGNIVIEAIVAQGCRPIGQPLRVTESERNILLALEVDANDAREAKSRAPLEVLQEMFNTLSDDDRELAQTSLFIGLARSEFKQQLEHGDFLIRNLIGVDPRAGAIAIGDRVRPGQRVQFHLRDARTSADDLQMLLARYQQQSSGSSPVGALMFSCLGRGERLYGKPNVDSSLFSQYVQHVPLSGFFCNGEIGPVSGSTFLHGYTSVFGICRQP
jgi:small ligand-binding sensory domain FIST